MLQTFKNAWRTPELKTRLLYVLLVLFLYRIGTVIPVPFGHNKPKGLGKPRTLSLKTVNFKAGIDRNAAALNNILEKYPLIKQRNEIEK